VARFGGVTRALSAGRTVHVRLRLSRRGAARVRRALRNHRRLVARVQLAARDGAGNIARNARRVELGA